MAPGCDAKEIEAACHKRFKYAAASTSDIQKREQIRRAMSQHGLPEWKLMELINAANERAEEEREEERAAKLRSLKQAWDQSKKTASDAPAREEAAERAYIQFADGQEAYIEVLKARYGKQAAEWAKQTADRHASYVSDLYAMLEDYGSMYLAAPHLADLLRVREHEESALVSALEQREGDARAGDRRVLYEVREREALSRFRTWEIVALYAVLVAYLATGDFFTQGRYKQWWTWLVMAIYIASPWIVGPLSQYIFWAGAWLSYQWRDRDGRNIALSY